MWTTTTCYQVHSIQLQVITFVSGYLWILSNKSGRHDITEICFQVELDTTFLYPHYYTTMNSDLFQFSFVIPIGIESFWLLQFYYFNINFRTENICSTGIVFSNILNIGGGRGRDHMVVNFTKSKYSISARCQSPLKCGSSIPSLSFSCIESTKTILFYSIHKTVFFVLNG